MCSRRFRASFLVLLLLLAAAGCRATGTSAALDPAGVRARAHAPRSEPVDIEHYRLELALLPEHRSLEGVCTIRGWAVEDGVARVAFDLEGLSVRVVRDPDGRELRHTEEPGRVIVDLGRSLAAGDPFELSIAYGGVPAKGLWFVGGRDGVPTHVFTQGECEDARWWFPCLDYPAERATSELVIDVPENWTTVAAGERIDTRIEGGRRIDTWRTYTSHPAYLETLVAGELVTKTGEWDGVPLSFLAEPRYEAWLDAAFEETDEILAFVSDVTGLRYPYPKYAQSCVGNFPFGGMENISASTLTRTTLRDERGLRDGDSDGLVAHEAAHQWFGDLLTCRDWSEIWLNEGFASYMTLLYFEHSRGIDEFRVRLRDTQDSYVRADVGPNRRPTVHNVYRDPMDLFFSGQTYAGGAARLHLLRHRLGDAAFFEGVRRYVQENVERGVVTADLRRAMEDASGQDLGKFFEQWFYRAGYPEFEVRWTFDERRGVVELTVEQVQEMVGGTPEVFEVEVDVEVRTPSARTQQRITVDRRRETFRLPSSERPIWVRFDKYGAVPKLLRSTKAMREWMVLAREDDDVNGRRDALRALGEELKRARESREGEAELVLAEIEARLAGDRVPAVRVTAAEVLGSLPSETGRDALLRAARTDPVASVRVAALRALKREGPDPELASLADQVFTEGYSWNVMGTAAELYASAAPRQAFAWLTARLPLASPHDRLRQSLLGVLAGLEDPGVRDELPTWFSDARTHQNARAAAARGLARFLPRDEAVFDMLVSALDTRLFRLRGGVLEALSRDPGPRELEVLGDYYRKTVFPRERRLIEKTFERASR